jgi:hypothetical protein
LTTSLSSRNRAGRARSISDAIVREDFPDRSSAFPLAMYVETAS